MDIQQTLDDAARFRERTDRMVARCYAYAAEVLSPAEIEECRQEAAALTSSELAALLADLAA